MIDCSPFSIYSYSYSCDDSISFFLFFISSFSDYFYYMICTVSDSITTNSIQWCIIIVDKIQVPIIIF